MALEFSSERTTGWIKIKELYANSPGSNAMEGLDGLMKPSVGTKRRESDSVYLQAAYQISKRGDGSDVQLDLSISASKEVEGIEFKLRTQLRSGASWLVGAAEERLETPRPWSPEDSGRELESTVRAPDTAPASEKIPPKDGSAARPKRRKKTRWIVLTVSLALASDSVMHFPEHAFAELLIHFCKAPSLFIEETNDVVRHGAKYVTTAVKITEALVAREYEKRVHLPGDKESAQNHGQP